jgi:hypothetical protein
MTMIRRVIVAFGLGIARLGGWVPPRLEDLASAELASSARMFVEHVQQGFAGQSGEFKRSQCLRALLNRHPEATERDCALSIELAVRAR